MHSYPFPNATQLRQTVRAICFLAPIAAALSISASARALTFDTTYDPSVAANFGTNTAAAENAFAYAESVYANMFSDPITINITMDGAAGTNILGESSTTLDGTFTYAAVRAALVADATTMNDVAALGSLPPTDPSPAAGSSAYIVSSAQAKALGLAGQSSSNDGMVTFGAGFSYTFGTTPASRAVAGQFDFVGVAEHEISEVMGRSGILGTAYSSSPNYGVLDLFGFIGTNARSFNQTDKSVYFSLNGGLTNLKGYNDPGNGDLRDWAGGSNDAYNAFTGPGVFNDITPVDMQEMDVIGYDLAPEPGSVALCAVAGLAMVIGVRRLRRQEACVSRPPRL